MKKSGPANLALNTPLLLPPWISTLTEKRQSVLLLNRVQDGGWQKTVTCHSAEFFALRSALAPEPELIARQQRFSFAKMDFDHLFTLDWLPLFIAQHSENFA